MRTTVRGRRSSQCLRKHGTSVDNFLRVLARLRRRAASCLAEAGRHDQIDCPQKGQGFSGPVLAGACSGTLFSSMLKACFSRRNKFLR